MGCLIPPNMELHNSILLRKQNDLSFAQSSTGIQRV